MSDPITDLMISTVDAMIVRSARRYVEARHLSNDIPSNIRREANKKIAAQKRVIERLVKFRMCLITERTR